MGASRDKPSAQGKPATEGFPTHTPAARVERVEARPLGAGEALPPGFERRATA